MPSEPQEARSAAQGRFRFRVEGTDGFIRASSVKLYDETFVIEAEHPVEALEKLLHEVEWSILDPERGFTVTYLPDEEASEAECGPTEHEWLEGMPTDA